MTDTPSLLTISTLLRWSDSFITIDRAFDLPQIWTLPRLLSRVFLSRINDIHALSNTRLIPEAGSPELFARVYTMTLLEFFSCYPNNDDPTWLQSIIAIYREYSADPINTMQQISSYITDPEMQTLADTMDSSLQLTQSRAAVDDRGQLVVYQPPPSNHTVNWDEIPLEEEHIPGISYTPRRLPDPPAFRLRTPNLHLDLGRNVSIQCPDGTLISTYDQPNLQPEMQQMGALMQQMAHQLEIQQQALQQTHEQARLAFQQAQMPRPLMSWQNQAYAPEKKMRDRSPSPTPYSHFGRRTPPLAFSQRQSSKESSPFSSSAPTTSRQLDDLHNQSPGKTNFFRKLFSKSPKTPTPVQSPPSSPPKQQIPDMFAYESAQWGSTRPKVESVTDDDDEELAQRNAEMEAMLADAKRQEQELSRTRLNSRHQDLATEYAETMERINAMKRLKEYQEAVHQDNPGSNLFDNNSGPPLVSSAPNPQDARMDPRKRAAAYGPGPARANAPARPWQLDHPEPTKPIKATSTFDLIDQFCDMMNRFGPAEAEHFRSRAAQLYPLTISPPPKPLPNQPPVPGGWPSSPPPTISAPQGRRSQPFPPFPPPAPPPLKPTAPTSMSMAPFQPPPISAPLGSRSSLDALGGNLNIPQPVWNASSATWENAKPAPIWNGQKQVWETGSSNQSLPFFPAGSAPPAATEASPWHASAPPSTALLPWHASAAQHPQPVLSVVLAPPGFQSIFPPLPANPTKKDRYHVSRVQTYLEDAMPLENWLANAFVDVYGYGEQAVCPLWGRHAFPQGSYLNLWFNALSYTDQLNLQVGDGIFHNWEFCLMMLRPTLDERLRTKAENRRKRSDETYPQYLAELYPLLKAAYRTDTEAAIIQRLKRGFDSWDAFHAMSEEYNFQQLENQAHRYERMRGLFGTQTANSRVDSTPSSYLPIGQFRSSNLRIETAPESSAFPARSSYQQTPATAQYKAADPQDFVDPAELHPDMRVGRISVPDHEIDGRAKTVNKRPSARHGGTLTRSYIKAYPRREVVFLNRDCSLCRQLGLSPSDHFNFEHNLYHASAKTYLHANGLPEVDQDSESDSENEWRG
ncbi:hypothetical protein BJ508DRAFT_321524 [Ascobolus immersus RN42]|uniref:Uncharacterized protein n=1 Tax=Ascobolus immersus RN42 TaxID=1160509 RepID=A0A3N4IQ89_ASCIM|nr:hypothetical protein BJ508DRAFT_321524 [Ascobolus immersus RN42]